MRHVERGAIGLAERCAALTIASELSRIAPRFICGRLEKSTAKAVD